MKTLLTAIIITLLTGCGAKNLVRDTTLNDPSERYCTYVNDFSNVFAPYTEATSTESHGAIKIPNSPIQIDLDNKADRELFTLYSDIGAENHLVMLLSRLAFAGLQSAPCHDGNRKEFWKTLRSMIDKTDQSIRDRVK